MLQHIPGVSDTARPITDIPIYFIHSLEQPFCDRSGCWCQSNQAPITQLLTATKTGALLLGKAENFADGKTSSGENV